MIVTRRPSREGRNRCYINGAAVTLGTMGELLSQASVLRRPARVSPPARSGVPTQRAGRVGGSRRRRSQPGLPARVPGGQETVQLAGGGRTVARETRLTRSPPAALPGGRTDAAALSLAEEQNLMAEQRLLARAEDLLGGAGLAADLLRCDGDEPDATGLVAQASAQLARWRGSTSDSTSLPPTCSRSSTACRSRRASCTPTWAGSRSTPSGWRGGRPPASLLRTWPASTGAPQRPL